MCKAATLKPSCAGICFADKLLFLEGVELAVLPGNAEISSPSEAASFW
jgi:hypothetical protein